MSDRKFTNGPFEEPWWLDIVSPGNWGEAIVKKGTGERADDVIARLPYVVKNGKISLPHYTQTLGIWMSENIRAFQRGNDQFNIQKEIIHDLIDQLPVKRNVDLVLDYHQSYILPFRWKGYSIDPLFSYRIMNLTNMQEVESNCSKSIKRDVNRGKKLLHIDDSPNTIEEFINLQNLTYRRQNRKNPIDNDITAEIISKTIKSGHGSIFIARDDEGKAHAGCFTLFDERVCYHLMSGQDTSFGNDCAMPFLLHHEILSARNTSTSFDFEGSMVEGIEQVYRRYGGNQVITWHVTHKSLISECKQILKPRVKKILGYKI